MKPNEKPNGRDTVNTSEVERPIQLTPSSQLQLEADDALDAIKSVLQEMRQTAANGLDPRKVAAEHPWVAVGSAAVAGFVGALLAVPSKEDAALQRLERIERALDAGAAGTPGANGHAADGAGRKPRTMFSSLMMKGYEVVKPTLLAALTSAITARAAGGNSSFDGGFEASGVEDAVETDPPTEAS